MMTEPSNYAELVNMALDGNGMSRKEAVLLQKELERDESQIVPRVKLLGYYFTRHHTNARLRLQRQACILKLINQIGDNRFLVNPFAIILKNDNPTNPRQYQDFREAWFRKIEENSTSISIILNAAEALSYSEPGVAEELCAKALLLAPDDERVQDSILTVASREARTRLDNKRP